VLFILQQEEVYLEFYYKQLVYFSLQESINHFVYILDFPRTNEGESSTMTSTNVEDNICNRSERVSNGPRRKQRK
jgi:hypothetical protein